MNAEPPHRPGDHSAPEEGYDIELAPVGLLVAASDGHVIATNQAWSELSNLSGPDSTGQGFLAALAPAERPRFRDDLRQVPAEPGSRLTPAGTPIEVADVIIAELIAIGFTLASCVNIADDMAFSRVARVVADIDRIVQRLDNCRTQPDQAWGAEPCLGEP